MIYERLDCRMCGGAVRPALSLTPTPIANSFPEKAFEGERHRLDLVECVECEHVQIRDVVPDEVLFPRSYRYATPKAASAHLEAAARSLREAYQHAKSVVEIGANNGLYLEALHVAGFQSVVGVDPCGSGWVWQMPFDMAAAKRIRERVGMIDLIVANNVFAHVDDLGAMFRAVDHCLSEDGALVFEVQYFPDMVRLGAFDMIYHEHRDYHTLKPWPKFLKKHGLVIKNVEHLDTHGGSIRVHCERPGIGIAVWQEQTDWRAFRRTIEQAKSSVTGQLATVSGRVVAFGATAKACTLIHHFKIADRIAYCVDETPAKQGRFIAGTAIEVSGIERLVAEPPAAMLLTAWNYEAIIRARFPGLRMIVPLYEQQRLAA